MVYIPFQYNKRVKTKQTRVAGIIVRAKHYFNDNENKKYV